MGCLSDVYFWRQCVVLIANCMFSVGSGFMLSFPSVLNPDILSPNSTGIHATPDQASWIASSSGISGFVGFCMAPYIMQIYGRKSITVGLNFLSGLGFLIFSLANNVPSLYAARIIQGIPMCSAYISTLIVGEYSHRKRRGYFTAIKKSTVAIGALMCHFLGRYDECEKTHRWLFGDSVKSKRELEELISSQMEVRNRTKDKENLRTCVVLMTNCMLSVGTGFMLSFPAVLNPDILSPNSTGIHATPDQASSIGIRYSKKRFLLRTETEKDPISPNRFLVTER
nr:uncharacterized protein LOC117993244 [Maniola hyperantus]